MDGPELVHAWVAIQNGLVSALGTDTPPLARETLSAKGGLVTPGLINTHHHIFQNLTRAYAPATNATLFGWLTTLSPLWARLDEEAAYVSAWIGLAELALGGYHHHRSSLYPPSAASARCDDRCRARYWPALPPRARRGRYHPPAAWAAGLDNAPDPR